MYKGERNDEGEPHGQGSFYWSDGRRYDGSLREGVFHGHGVMTWSAPHPRAGAKYEGEFRDGKRNGEGVSVDPDRVRITDDALVTAATMYNFF